MDTFGVFRTPGAVPRPADPDDITLLQLVNAVLRRRRLIVWVALVFAVAVTATTLLLPRTYGSRAAFMPQSRADNSRFSAVASQLGLPASGNTNESSAFYADLLVDRPLLRAVVDSQYALGSSAVTTDLVDLYGGRGNRDQRREEAIRRLRKNVTVDISLRTGVVTFTVVATQPRLAHQIAQRMLALVNDFNLRNYQSQAGAERRFAEHRLAEIRSTLRAAEGRLQDFLQRNRDFMNSPALQFDHDRLLRDVDVNRQLYAVVLQMYERAGIEEVRDVPVITVVAPPEVPVSPNPRKLLVRLIFALLTGALIGIIWAVMPVVVGVSRDSRSEESEEFLNLKRDTLRDMARPWRLLGPRQQSSRIA